MNSSNKIVLLGDSGVGKSTIMSTLIGVPDSRPHSTVGCAIQILPHQYAAGTPQESLELLELWDIGGSNVHRQASSVFFDNVSGIIFVHDLSNSKSEQNLAQWHELFYNHRSTQVHHSTNRLGMEYAGSPFIDVERTASLPTLIIGSRLDLAPHRAKDQIRSVVSSLKPFESVFLDCRKEISPGSTNRIIFSRFFDAVVEKARSVDERTTFSQARRRKLV